MHSVGEAWICQLRKKKKTQRDTGNLSLCLTVSVSLFRALSCSSTPYNLHLISISKNHIFMSHASQALWWVCHYSVMKPGQLSLPHARLKFRVVGRHFASHKFTKKHTLSQSREGMNVAGCTRARQRLDENVLIAVEKVGHCGRRR